MASFGEVPGAAHGDLFTAAAARDWRGRPLAERMRPRRLHDVVGQPHLLGTQGALTRLAAGNTLPSMILWGPPGTGKTTLAHAIAQQVDLTCETLSAVMAGVKELRAVVDAARTRRAQHRRGTLLFIDEIHRFNKVQQDALLPHIEAGTVTLIGATTENPAFELRGALLSRCRVFALRPLAPDELIALLRRALDCTERGLAHLRLIVTDAVLAAIGQASGGDGRAALTTLDLAARLATAPSREIENAVTPAPQGPATLTLQHVRDAAQQRVLAHDKDGEAHYHLISALIKSLRASDPDAAVYYTARLIEAGEAPRFVLRRLIIFASEDIGLADPQALVQATAALTAFDMVGLPEGTLPMTQAVLYLACAPKSRTVIQTYAAAQAQVAANGTLPVPMWLRPGAMGDASGRQSNLPAELAAQPAAASLFEPSGQGVEARIVAAWRGRQHIAAGHGPLGNPAKK